MPEGKMTVKGSGTLGGLEETPDTGSNTTTQDATIAASTLAVDDKGNLQNADSGAITQDTQGTGATTTNDASASSTTTASTATPEEYESSFDLPNTGQTQAADTQQQDTTQQANNTVSWKDAIKNVDRKELLKEIGLDEFDITFADFRKNGGDPIEYLNAKAIDWNKVSDADLIINEMKGLYPDATPQQLQRLFNKKYNQIEVADEEDKEDGLLQLRADARALRQNKIATQQNFKMPEKVQINQPQGLTDEQRQLVEAVVQQNNSAQQLADSIIKHNVTQNILNSKRVAIETGLGHKFNFKVENPQLLLDILLKPEVNTKYGRNEQGEPDVDTLYALALHKANPKQFVKDLINHGKALGKRELITEGQGANPNTQRQHNVNNPNETEKQAWKARAKSGTLNGG